MRYKESTTLVEFANVVNRSFESCNPENAKASQKEYSHLFEQYFPLDGHYALLNLTSREYVVSKGLWGRELGEDPRGKTPNLGDAAMTGICWSQVASTSMEYPMETEGRWACYRFVIVNMSLFDSKGWKDISADVHNVLSGIWKVEFGEQLSPFDLVYGLGNSQDKVDRQELKRPIDLGDKSENLEYSLAKGIRKKRRYAYN